MIVFGLVLLFIIRLRFPNGVPISTVINRRYGRLILKTFRNYEKLDLKKRKIECDLNFLNQCRTHGLTPKFVHFKLYNRNLSRTKLYRDFQKQILNREIEVKKKSLKKLNTDLKYKLSELKSILSWLDFNHIKNFVCNVNSKHVTRFQNVQKRKLFRLGLESEYEKLDPDKLIFNLSSRVLTSEEKDALSLGLKFAFPTKKLNFYHYFLPFERLISCLKDHNIYGDDTSKNIFNSDFKHLCLSYFYNFDHFKCQGPVSSEHVKILKRLSKDKNLLILKPDKGNGIVLLDRDVYFNKMNDILDDREKFKPVHGDCLKIIFKLEDKLNRFLRSLKELRVISESVFNYLYASGSQPGIMYGLPKVHKGNCPLRPILSAIGTHTYNLAKFIVPTLEKIAYSSFTVKDTFNFVTEIMDFKNADKYKMASFDVTSLFTNIPLDETINIILELLFPDNNSHYLNFNRQQYKKLLELAVKDNIFFFNKELYSQTDGVAMGSPLGPILANIFMSYHEEKWLSTCPKEFKPVLYRRYVDDTFLLFREEAHIQNFLTYLNSQHPNINFTVEKENNGSLPFLDIDVNRVNDEFVTNVYRKKTFTGLGMNFDSSIPIDYKRNLIMCLVVRAYRICSNYVNFTNELEYLRKYFLSNKFPIHFIEKCIRITLNNIFIRKEKLQTVSQKIMYLKIPFYGPHSYSMKRKLVQLFRKYYPQINLRVIMTNNNTLGSLFRFKDRLPTMLCSGIIYKYSCGECDATYVGKSQRHFKSRISEHRGVSVRTGQPLTNPSLSSIRDHAWEKGHRIIDDNFEIITRSAINSDLLILESLAIHEHHPTLNEYNSVRLHLF